MKRFLILPLIAIVGILFVIRVVITGSVPAPVPAPVVDPAKPPFAVFVAGSGVIEASSENISIASPLAGTIKEVFVKVGDSIAVNQPLFALDDRDSKAEIDVRAAQVARAESVLEDARVQLSIYRGVHDARAIVKGELLKRQSAVAVADAALKEARAQLAAANTTHERMTIRSPIQGEVLQVRARVGEFAPAQILTSPLMIVGTCSPLAVRVDIDENDAWRVEKGAQGVATLRGNSEYSFPIKFERFEPFVVPKRSLTGESFERVDTRVLQVVFRFERGTLPVYVGQLVDVYIQSDKSLQ